MARACEICGSRKWRRDAITGGARCDEGHLRQGYRAETLVVDQGAANFHMIKRRKGTGGPRRNKRKEEGRADPEYYHGFEAEYLRIQALQLLLRLQIQALSKLWSLPDIYEVIVRDLWAYQLSISSLPTLPERYDRSESQSPIPASQKPNIEPSHSDVIMGDEEEEGEQRGTDSEGEEEGSEKHASASESASSDEGSVDPEILERLDESDKEEGLNNIDQDGSGTKQGDDVKWKRKKLLKISDTIITLAVGLWILRIPVMGADIENLVNQIDIPYVDFGHTTHMPAGMKKRMNRDVMIALSPLRSPSPAIIHRSCRIFARVSNKRYGIQVPEINIQPVAWRITSALGGTPTTYAQVTRLMTILDVNLSLIEKEIGTISRRIRSRVKPDPDASDVEEGDDKEERIKETTQLYDKALLYLDVVAPELAVLAIWLIVMKMVYGLDAVTRQALLRADPAIGLPVGITWVKELTSRLESGVLRGKRVDLEKQDFTKMDDDEMDTFLARCQQVLLGDREEPSDVGPFPLPPPTNLIHPLIPPNSWVSYHSSTDRIIHQPSFPTPSNTTNNKSLPLMPGEKVRSYDSSDPLILNDLPTDFEVVLNAGCEVIGWDQREVLRVLEGFERKLERIRPKNNHVSQHIQSLAGEEGLEHGGEDDEGPRSMTPRRRPATSRRGSSSAVAVRAGSRPTSRVGSEVDDSDYVDTDNQHHDRDEGRQRPGLDSVRSKTRTRTRSISQTRERPTSRSRSRRGSTASINPSTNPNTSGSGSGKTRLGALSRESSITRFGLGAGAGAGAGAAGRRSRETSLSRSGSTSVLVHSGSRSRLKSSRSFG
ncbi:hypothetical protein IAT40_006858 [Kwoniella sp. CBS 6097]